MITVLIIMIVGMISGYLLKENKKILRASEKLTTLIIFALLFMLGIGVGLNNKIISNIDTIGWQAAAITSGAILGSLIFDTLRINFFLLLKMKSSLIILLFFVLGLILGLTQFIPLFLIENDFTMYILYALMFFVGIGIGSDTKAFRVIKKTKIKIILVPLGVIAGSLLGAVVVSFFFSNMNEKEAMAVAAGFGYYSLSSIFITKISGEFLGTVALLSNVFRELITLVATPVFIKYFGKLAGIASGGATAIDSTLPIITEYSGREWGIIAIFSGIVLTIIVPFLVPFILT